MVVAKFASTTKHGAIDGKTQTHEINYYNLDMIIKNHVFIDGNKRIAATLFIYILFFYNILNIDNNTLVALTILIAESNPKEKDILINLIINLIY